MAVLSDSKGDSAEFGGDAKTTIVGQIRSVDLEKSVKIFHIDFKGLFMTSLLLVWLICFSFPHAIGATIASVMTELQRRSEESASDVVLVSREGQLIFQYPASITCSPIDSQEMAKACLALAYAFLLEEQKIPCLDVPVRCYFPDNIGWNSGWHAFVTLKHLLNETSGLDQEECLCSTGEDVLMPAIFPPGELYRENGNHTRLLLSLVEKISGETFEAYLLKKLFIPLGIQSASWSVASLGEPLHLYLLPADWMKIGHFLLCRGSAGNRQLLSTHTLHRFFAASQPFNPFFGLGWSLEFYDMTAWWDETLLTRYYNCRVVPPLVYLLGDLYGRQIHFTGKMRSSAPLDFQNLEHEPLLAPPGVTEDLLSVLYEKGLPLCRFQTGKLKSFSALGKGGQQLYIYPQGKLVALRQKKIRCSGVEEDAFEDFSALLEKLSSEYNGWVD